MPKIVKEEIQQARICQADLSEKPTSGVVCPPEKGRADAGNNPTSARLSFQFLLLAFE